MTKTINVDPPIQQVLDILNKLPPIDIETYPVAKGREDYLKFSLLHAGWPLRLSRVEDLTIDNADGEHTMGIRIYTPELNKKLPALIYYHGGGWQRGDLATHDSICRHFATFGECIVVAVDWRLAPEHRHPKGINDCLTAYQWVIKNGEKYNIDTQRIGIGGDSAGGNMTAITAHRLRKMDIQQPHFQLLLYASLDLTMQSSSYKDFAEGYFLTTDRTKFYIDKYINKPEDVEDPLFSPAKEKDLTGLPRTHIITAGFDPLRGESEAYAQRLEAAGNQVSYKCYETMIHAFLHMTHTSPAAKEAIQEISAVLKEALAR